jgi:hypothetical protein
LDKNANFDAKTTLEPAEYFFCRVKQKNAAIGNSSLSVTAPNVYLYIGLELSF